MAATNIFIFYIMINTKRQIRKKINKTIKCEVDKKKKKQSHWSILENKNQTVLEETERKSRKDKERREEGNE